MNSAKLILTYLLQFTFICSVMAQKEVGHERSLDSCSMGQVFIANYQFESAIAALNVCYKETPQSIDYLKKLALCNTKLGRFKESKRLYKQILAIDSVNITALNQIGVIYLKELNYDRSLEQFERLVRIDSTNSYYQQQLAELYLKRGEVERAIIQYEKTLRLNPEDVLTIADLCKVYQVLELYGKADVLIEQGRRLDPSNVKLMLYQAKSAYKQKKYPTVITSVNEILASTNDSSAYYLKLLGIASFHTEAYLEAIDALEKVVKQNQGSEVIHYYLGLAYRSIGQGERSIAHFEQAIEHGISDNVSVYYQNLGVTYEEQGDFSASIRAYQAAYKSSQDKILLYHLARNYDFFYKDKKTALHYYELYLASNDTGNMEFMDHSNHRISELKEIIHFGLDTLE